MAEQYILSVTDRDTLRDILAAYRAGELGRPKVLPLTVTGRSDVMFGVPDATISGTTTAVGPPGSGTVSVYRFTSTGGTTDTGRNETVYNLRSTNATTAQYVVCGRDHESGNWLILPIPQTALAPYVECVNCSDTGPNSPQYMSVALSGFANSTCTACADYDGTYILSGSTGVPCSYTLTIPTSEAPCGGPNPGATDLQINLTKETTGTRYFIEFKMILRGCVGGFGADTIYWATTPSTAKLDCMNFNSVPLTYQSSRATLTCGLCDATGATCNVTSGS